MQKENARLILECLCQAIGKCMYYDGIPLSEMPDQTWATFGQLQALANTALQFSWDEDIDLNSIQHYDSEMFMAIFAINARCVETSYLAMEYARLIYHSLSNGMITYKPE